jgi:uncharacterized membrane protein
MRAGGPLTSAWVWRLSKLTRSAGVRATAFAALATATAAVAYFVRDIIPERFNDLIGASAVESLLNVLASSLLSVTTFTLGAMVSAYGSAANATPRATPLIIADETSQNVLSTFVGAFVFSIVGLVMLRTGVYGGGGRAVLFAATIFVILLVVIVLLRWIARVSHLGLISDSIDRAEDAVLKSLQPWMNHPRLGARPARTTSGAPVASRRIGYVQHIDMQALQGLAEKHSLTVHLMATPGDLVAPPKVLAQVEGDASAAVMRDIDEAFHIDSRRTFDYDPRFGFLVLSEIASKALSPGINDPGTALDVLVRVMRLLSVWARRERRDGEGAIYNRLHAPDLRTGDLFDDAFDAVARDGAGLVEVAMRVQTALTALASCGDPPTADAAKRHSRRALARAEAAIDHADDFSRVRGEAIAGQV